MKAVNLSLTVLCVALLAGAGCATPVFQDGPAAALAAGSRLGRNNNTMLQPPAKPLAGLASPKAMVGKVQMAGKLVPVAIDAQTADGEMAVLRFDLAGRGDFQTALVVELQVPKSSDPNLAMPSGFFHYQAELPGVVNEHPLYLEGDITPAIRMSGTDDKTGQAIFCISQLCAGVRSGRVGIGGESHSVALVDTDGNALFNDADGWEKVQDQGQLRRHGDAVLVDFGKGDFSEPANVRPVLLNHLLEVAGTFYEFRPDPMGKTLKVKPAKVAFGKLRFEAGAMKVIVRLSGQLTDVAVDSVAGDKRVPADKYRVVGAQIKDPASKAMILLKGLPPVEVKAGQTLSVPLDPALECRIAVAPMNDQRDIVMSAKLTTGAGQSVAYVYGGDGRMVLVGFEVQDVNGKKIHQGNFEYG